ncbi:Cyclin-L1-1 [Vitis vinifera]|uniref:Cyclin-L1-1 n=1 Tax=Vitis vinifera TaxID=29760 RepID=A0A438JRK4_VITVI|nr:Cyclin-L1-1 [Vitis vinifera]
MLFLELCVCSPLNSLRTTLCVQFKSEVVACGVVYAAARRFQVPLPENEPWWEVFDAEKSAIDEVCRVLAHLYSLPKAQHIPVCKDGDSFTSSNKSRDSQTQPVSKEVLQSGPLANNDTVTPKAASTLINPESGGSKNSMVKQALDMLKESKKGDDDPKSMAVEGEGREEPIPSKSEHRTEASGERNKRGKGREKGTGTGTETGKGKEQKHGTVIEEGILIGNGSVMRLTRTGRRRAFREIKASLISRYAFNILTKIGTTTAPLILQGRRIAIDIILTLEPVAKVYLFSNPTIRA